MSQVVTELVIDSNTAGAADFSRAMDGAEEAANRGVAAATGFNIGVAALGAGAVAAGAGVKALLDYVVDANKQLADLQSVAHQVGLSLTDIQGIQFGAAIKGLSAEQVNSGLEKSASLLNDASRNANSLSKELDANGISIRNANGQLISENQLLGIAANLIKNANNPGDQLAIAQMLGFTKEWIPLLEQGSAAMSGLAAEAKAAGAIIDDATIEKAAEFDAAWRKSSVELSSYMKAAFSGLLPLIDDLILGAKQWVKELPGPADIKKAVDENNKAMDKAIGDATGLPLEDDAIAIKFTVSQGAQDSWDSLTTKIGKAYNLLKWLSEDPNTQKLLSGYGDFLGTAMAYLASGGPLGNGLDVGGGGSHFPIKAKFIDPNSVPGFAASQMTEPSYPTDEQMAAAFDKANPPNPGSRSHPLAGLSASDYAGGGSAVAGKDVAGDAVDRAINQLQKHTEQQLADAQAVGLGDAALAGFKAEAAETAAVMANGGKETDAQVDKFNDLKDAAAAAAAALAKAKVASQIEFGGKTALLSQGDVAIAQQLKGIYGNDVTAALNSAEAAQLRFNATARELSSTIENDLVTGLTDIADGQKKVGQGATDMGLAVVKAIEQMIIKIAVVTPLMQALQQAASGLGIGAINPIAAGGVVPGAIGPTSVGGAPLVGLHGGGIVGSEATFSRYVHPACFDAAPRLHGGGIAGDEVPIIARKGEGVFTEGQMAALGARSAPVVNVTLIETPGGGGGVTQKQNSNGGIDIEVAIAQITAKSAATPGAPLNRALTDNFGARQRLASR